MTMATDLVRERSALPETEAVRDTSAAARPSGEGQGEVVLSVRNVSKKFCKNLRRSMAYGIADLGRNLVGVKPDSTSLRKDEFWALDDVSFELRRGEALGLIGVNGSGKTTLLRLIAGIFPPDKGEITVKGRVGALIAVGAGFHPHMTGRESIYLNGTILGMSREEIDDRFEDIVDFAEIGDFLEAPVATYSSGMRVRLGFSIATAIEPDVLLLDEILAVGDAGFRNKCYNRIGDLSKDAAVVFVSHNMNHVSQVCNRAALLRCGRLAHFGNVATAVQNYLDDSENEELESQAFEKIEYPVRAVSFKCSKLDVEFGEKIDLVATIDVDSAMVNAALRIQLYDVQGVVAAEWNGKRAGLTLDLEPGLNILRIELGPLFLKGGQYKLAFVLNDSDGIRLPVWSYKKYTVRVRGLSGGGSPYQLPVFKPQARVRATSRQTGNMAESVGS